LVRAAASHLDVSRDTVRKWRTQFMASLLEEAPALPRAGCRAAHRCSHGDVSAVVKLEPLRDIGPSSTLVPVCSLESMKVGTSSTSAANVITAILPWADHVGRLRLGRVG